MKDSQILVLPVTRRESASPNETPAKVFTRDCRFQLDLMRSAFERMNLDIIALVAGKLGPRCSAAGAPKLMHLSFQLHVNAKLGKVKQIPALLSLFESEFEKIVGSAPTLAKRLFVH